MIMAMTKRISSVVLVVATVGLGTLTANARDFSDRTQPGLNVATFNVQAPAVTPGGVQSAVLTMGGSGAALSYVQYRRPLGYWDRWGHFHYYPYAYVYRGRDWDDYRFRRGDRDDHWRHEREEHWRHEREEHHWRR